MHHSDNLNEIFTALAKFRGELPKISKDAKANYGKYATLDSLIEAVSPTLAKNGLTFSQLITTTDHGDGLITMLMHSSGQWFNSTAEIVVESNARIAGAQAQGSAITYARRYGLAAALGVAPDDDDDGAAASQPPKNYTKPLTPPAQRTVVSDSPVDAITRAKLHAKLGSKYDDVVSATVEKTGGNLTQASALAILAEIEKREG